MMELPEKSKPLPICCYRKMCPTQTGKLIILHTALYEPCFDRLIPVDYSYRKLIISFLVQNAKATS